MARKGDKNIWWIRKETANRMGLKIERRNDNTYFLITVVNKKDTLVYIFSKEDIKIMNKIIPNILGGMQ